MTPIPVPRRWLGALLGIALLVDITMVVEGTPTRTLLSLPGAVLIAVCAWLGILRPAIGAMGAALTLTIFSVLMHAADVSTTSVGLAHIMLTELISGVVLVVLVVWRTPGVVAFASVTALVVSCVSAILIRQPACLYGYPCETGYGTYFGPIITPPDLFESLFFGFVLLVGGVAAGLFLRRAGRKHVETEMGALVSKQWPLGAALGVLALVQLAEGGVDGTAGFLASVVAGICAFFGIKYPLRNTYLATGAFMFGALFSAATHMSGHALVPFTGMAASMALVAYLIRYVPLGQAFWAVTVLSGALLVLTATQVGLSTVVQMLIYLLFLLLVSIATGWYFRARDGERSRTVKAAVTTAQQGERMALARELHDVVAHHVTGIVVQAQAALMVAERNPDVALPALERIERSGTAALTAMRTLVGSLREGTAAWVAGSADATGEATTDLVADLRALVEDFTGPPVGIDLDLPDELPHEMGRSVLRLVQESLTNVGKHAPDASTVHVRVATNGDTLHIRVSDDGRKRPANPAGGSGGYGLVGMRERVELLGGTFEAGPSGYVGWNVEAWLPLRKEES